MFARHAKTAETQSEFVHCAQMYERLADESRQHAVRRAHERTLVTSSGRG